MAVHRYLGEIDKNDFENHLKAPTRREGYLEIIMYTPDPNIQIANVTSTDVLNICDITAVTNLDKYTSNTVATLEENLWLLNGRYIIYQGGTIDGYISNSISDENGEFETKPTMKVQLSHARKVEDFSIILNAAVPSGYPKDIKVKCYDVNDNLLGTYTTDIEWEEPTGEVDEDDQPIYRTRVLNTLPSVNFSINEDNVGYLIIEYGNTRFRHRRIRVSSIMFAKTIVLDQSGVTNVDYTDKTSYVCDTLPSRVFKFDVNNYDSLYNIDNPSNSYVSLDKRTRVRFRNGYNVYGYTYDELGYVVMEDGKPVMDIEQEGIEIEWDNWKELRLMDIEATAEETATFTAGSLLDIMEDTYTEEYYPGTDRSVESIVDNLLTFEGLDLDSVEWSTDGIKKPTYHNGQLLPYEQWTSTPYFEYVINTPLPETSCKQIMQYIAFVLGATILIKDDGHIKFANLDINNSSSFTNNYEWNYSDFTSIPEAEQLPSVSKLSDISMPKYYSSIDETGDQQMVSNNSVITNGNNCTNCTVITTVTCTAMSVEVTYSDCMPIGARISNEDTSGATLVSAALYTHRGIINLGGYVAGRETKVEILGYPIITKTRQERNVTSNSLVLDTKIMKTDISSYNTNATVKDTEQIKRKYLEWYKKKFKYKIKTRGEPLVNAGDYAIIQTQFTQQMPVYILQNHWTFDGAWDGDMEVIALD